MRRARPVRSTLGPIALGALLSLAAAPASAQPAPKAGAFAVDRFEPTPPGDRFVSIKDGAVAGEELFRAALTLDYARSPLAVPSAPALVADQLVLHADLSLALWERVLLSMSLPVVLLDRGAAVTLPGSPPLTIGGPTSADLGDIALGARVEIFVAAHDRATLGAGADFWLPTGNPANFTGDPRVRAMPYASFSGALSHFVYASHAGVLLRSLAISPTCTSARRRDSASRGRTGRAAARRARPRAPRVDPDYARSRRPRGPRFGGAARVDAASLGDLLLGAGFGPGLVRGVGTPSFRGLVSIRVRAGRRGGVGSRRIIDRFDACPDMPGTPNEDPELNGCPSDCDGDGVLDVADACADEPGVPSTDARANGCPIPTDRDGDRIPDKVDACPDDRGPPSRDPKKNGCPADRDGDGVPDAEDACPDLPGVADENPRKERLPARRRRRPHRRRAGRVSVDCRRPEPRSGQERLPLRHRRRHDPRSPRRVPARARTGERDAVEERLPRLRPVRGRRD